MYSNIWLVHSSSTLRLKMGTWNARCNFQLQARTHNLKKLKLVPQLVPPELEIPDLTDLRGGQSLVQDWCQKLLPAEAGTNCCDPSVILRYIYISIYIYIYTIYIYRHIHIYLYICVFHVWDIFISAGGVVGYSHESINRDLFTDLYIIPSIRIPTMALMGWMTVNQILCSLSMAHIVSYSFI